MLESDLKARSNRRIGLTVVVLSLIYLSVLSRVWTLQDGAPETWSRLARAQQIQNTHQPPRRGRILDREGRVLVDHRPIFILRLVEELDLSGQFLSELERVLGLDSVRNLLAQGRVRIPHDRLAAVSEVTSLHPGLVLSEASARSYPHGNLAGHVLGYVQDSTPSAGGGRGVRGVEGLEAQYDEVLSGVPGLREVLVSAQGLPLGLLSATQSREGRDIHLALDLKIQKRTEQALSKASDRLRGKRDRRPEAPSVALAMEIPSGEILAMASRPSYSPTLFLASDAKLGELLNDPTAPLINRAIAGLYPAASTFKLVTALSVLEAKPEWAAEGFHCSGSQTIGETVFHCFVTTGHGALTFEEALAYSCDTVFYDLAVRLGPERLLSGAQALGFGQPTGLDLPGELPGLLPTPAWIEREFERPWYDGDSANLGVGQGYLLVTPIQLAVGVARLLCDRPLQPRLLKQSQDHAVQPVSLRPSLRRIWNGARGAVLYGTSTGVDLPGLEVSGKTGTAEAPTTEDNPEGLNHVWFVGWAPAEAPEVVALAFFEGSGGYGGEVAVPVVAEILDAWMEERKPGVSLEEVSFRIVEPWKKDSGPLVR